MTISKTMLISSVADRQFYMKISIKKKIGWAVGRKPHTYPLVIFYIAIEHTPIIVSCPIKNGGSFHSYVAVYQAG